MDKKLIKLGGTTSLLLLRTLSFFIFFQLFLSQIPTIRAEQVLSLSMDGNPYRHKETLDAHGKYILEWLVDLDKERILFNVTCQTNGYVGFGLSAKGRMHKADIVIGGVDKQGNSYFTDRHGLDNQPPKLDDSQDWTLLSAWEKDSTTFLSFSRALDTCDVDDDYPITNNLQTLIWAYGETDDDTEYHFQNRGEFAEYLLDPDLTPRNLQALRDGSYKPSDINIFNITQTITTKSGQDTLYWCSIHKVPFPQKGHVIGFNTAFPTDHDRQHVHHLTFFRCRSPPGRHSDEFFGNASKTQGTECYIISQAHPLPVPYCQEVFHVWALGGKPIFFPEHVGIPMPAYPNEYVMLEVHYDTPQNISVDVTVSLEIFHSSKLREYDVGVIFLGDVQAGVSTELIPPSSLSHHTYMHCAPDCSKRAIPEDGANVFAVQLHSHTSGRALRMMHFRNNTELSFLQYDDNYNYQYQPIRILPVEKKILPGDQVILRCTYDTTNRNNSVIYSGFSSREEMCASFIYYYSRNPAFALCGSEIRAKEFFDFLGFANNLTWNQSTREMVINEPPQFAGLSISDYVNHQINWTISARRQLQEMQTYLPQVSYCPRLYYEDSVQQIWRQLESGILERTGSLPGSDGKAYISVDEDFQHVSTLPRGIMRYSPPPQCSNKT